MTNDRSTMKFAHLGRNQWFFMDASARVGTNWEHYPRLFLNTPNWITEVETGNPDIFTIRLYYHRMLCIDVGMNRAQRDNFWKMISGVSPPEGGKS